MYASNSARASLTGQIGRICKLKINALWTGFPNGGIRDDWMPFRQSFISSPPTDPFFVLQLIPANIYAPELILRAGHSFSFFKHM